MGRLMLADLDAERAVLGSLLQFPEFFSRVSWLTPDMFTQPRHKGILPAIRESSRLDRVEIPDRLGVLDELRKAGALTRDPGLGVYLAELTSLDASPQPLNIRWYAHKVLDAYRRRELVAMSERLIQACETSDTDDLASFIAELANVAADLTAPVDDAKQAVRGLYEMGAFVDARKPERDWVIPNLLARGERVIVVATEGAGKRLRVDEPIPTPSGWTTMGALRPGDQVFGRDGMPCEVVSVSDVEPYPDAYAIEFSDGSVMEADAEHQWVTVDYRSRQRDHATSVVTTEQIRATLMARGGHTLNHAVPVAGGLDLPDAELPIPPYVLGVWLGDGDTNAPGLTLNRQDANAIESGLTDDGVAHHRVPSGDKPGSVRVWMDLYGPKLRAAGMLGHKHIPDTYLRASKAQRWALLRGLMDTDGYVTGNGERHGRGGGLARCELTFTCKTLVPGAVELVRSLGIICSVAESDAVLEGRIVGRRWRIGFTSPVNPFTVPRKGQRWVPLSTRRSTYRYITAVRRCEPTPMRCISVNSPDRTYLAGRRMIPTHNTMLARAIAIGCASGVHPFDVRVPIPPVRTLLADLENPEDIIQETSGPLVGMMRHRNIWTAGNCHILHRPGGLDLRKATDQRELERAIQQTTPDIICLGPIYKTFGAGAGEKEENAARDVAMYFDRLRERYGVAFWLEHHAPLEQNGNRAMRPIGTSLWQRWPEFGIGLRKVESEQGVKMPGLVVDHWRGQRSRGREWPDQLWPDSPDGWAWRAHWDADPSWMKFARAQSGAAS